MVRNVIVISGLPFSGKSWVLEQLKLALKEHVVVRIDDIYQELYRGRADTHVTKTEHVFKNERLRHEILKLLVLGTPCVLTEMVMLTREAHQEPFMEMVGSADEYARQIEQECAVRDRRRVHYTAVQMKAILLHCSPEAVKKRAKTVSAERAKSNSPITTLKGITNAVTQFEFPVAYEPLVLDTSDESPQASADRIATIMRFLGGEMIPSFEADAALQKAKRNNRELLTLVQSLK